MKKDRVPLPEYLIDQILPSCEVSLLGGPSGSGKSRWLFDTLLAWQDGLPVLGHQSHPVSWIYVSSDRSTDSVRRTLESMGIDPKRIPLVPAWDENMGINQIMDVIEESHAGLAVIESFGSFVDDPTSKSVKQLLNITQRMAKRFQITFIGVVESPKMKPYERYENPRQRISGAAAWSHFSETIFLMEPTNPKMPGDPYRTLYVCPRNGTGQVVDLCFDQDGRLIPSKLAASAGS